MAIIQTIRNRYAKLAGGVIVLALVGFVLMDYGKRGFSGSTTAAKINGEKIDINDFNTQVNDRLNQIKQSNPQADMTEDQQEQVKTEVWDLMIGDILMKDIYNKLGVAVSENELRDMFSGPMPNQTVVQYFTDPKTGQFDPAVAGERYKYYQNTKDSNERRSWAAFKDDLVKNRREEKISGLVACAGFTPKAILDIQHKLRNTLANVEFVQIPYSLVSDDKVKVSQDEIKKYLEAHRALFENKIESRDIEYVAFSNNPSSADSAAMFAQLDTLKAQLLTAESAVEFASMHSDRPVQEQDITKEAVQNLPNGEEIMAAGVGTVVGPFMLGTDYALLKVLGKADVPDSVEVRHILVMERTADGQEVRSEAAAKQRIDSLVAALSAGASFDSLAARFSDDQGSAQNGGKYTFPAAQKPGLTKEFGDFAFSGAVEEKKLVHVDQGYKGYHYIEILRRGATVPQSKIVILAKNFAPSEATKQEVSNQANTFASKAAAGATAFDKEVQAQGLLKKEAPGMTTNSVMVQGLGVSRELVSWAAKAKVGEVSPLCYVNNQIVVAKLTAINKKGELNNSKAALTYAENEIRNKKKAEILLKEYKGKGDLNAIATASSQQINTVDSMTFYFPNNAMLSGEGKVVGYVFSNKAKDGATSEGIAGEMGVYFVKVNRKTDNSAGQQRDIAKERMMAASALKMNGYRAFLASRMENADIKDERYKFIDRM